MQESVRVRVPRWSWRMKELRVLNESLGSSVKPQLSYDILAKTCSWELYSTCFFLLLLLLLLLIIIIIIIIKVKIQSVSSVLSVPSCWSLTIIIVWENHKRWRLTDCLGVGKLWSKHQSINQSIIYFNVLRQRAQKLVQNTNVCK